MKRILVGTFSLAALVATATISAKTVRAAGSLEDAKVETGLAFGEMDGLNGRAASAVNASGDGAGRPALLVDQLDAKALRARPEVPSPAPTGYGDGGMVAEVFAMVGTMIGFQMTTQLVLAGGIGLGIVGLLGLQGAVRAAIGPIRARRSFKHVALTTARGFAGGALTLAQLGNAGGRMLGKGVANEVLPVIRKVIRKITSIFK